MGLTEVSHKSQVANTSYTYRLSQKAVLLLATAAFTAASIQSSQQDRPRRRAGATESYQKTEVLYRILILPYFKKDQPKSM